MALIKAHKDHWFLEKLISIVVCIVFLLPPAVVAQQEPAKAPPFQLETELLLEVLLNGSSLDISVLAYRRGDTLFLSLSELMDALRFPIKTDPSTGQAGGWFIEEEREFFLDMNQAVVVSNDTSFTLDDDVVLFDDQIFVAEPSLEEWFPLELELLLRKLALNAVPSEIIPLQASMNRRSSRVIGVGSTNRQPQLPFQETPYELIGRHSTDLRINTLSTLRDDDDLSTNIRGNYALLSRGDLAWMTSTIALSGSDRNDISSGRVKLERRLQRPFLELDYVELGDVETGNRGILVRGGGTEPGVRGTFTNESIDLRGNIPPDWEVELYRNGTLIDTQVVDGDAQYEFLEVPLEFGENRFEFVFYGPFGDKKTDERVVFAGDGLDAGDASYTLSAVQDGKSVIEEFAAGQKGTEGSGRYLANFNLGVGAGTTARLSFDSFESEGDRLLDSSLGLSKSFSLAQTSIGYNRRARALDSVTGSVRGRLGEQTSASLSYSEFLVTDIEDRFVPENRRLWTSALSLSSRVLDNPFSFSASRNQREVSSDTSLSLGTTIPTSFTRVSKAFFYNRQESDGEGVEESSGGSFNFSFDVEPWRFRSGGAYSISPDTELTSAFASADIRLERRMGLNFDVRHRPQIDLTTYRMGLSWGLEYVQISPQVSYDSEERWVGLVSLSTSFNPRPSRAVPAISRLSLADFGSVHARAFLDDNGDGVWSEGEAGVEGVEVEAVQSYRTAVTEMDGNGYLTRLRDNRVTDVAIDPASLPELSLNATSPGVSIRPRPGSWSTVDFPIIRTTELEGYVNQVSGAERNPEPMPRLLVRLVNQDGQIVSQQRAVFDGFYLFSEVPPGTYDLELKDEYEDRLIERPGKIKVTSAGGIVRDLDFLIGREIQTLAQSSGTAPGPDAEKPRIIAPIVPQEDVVSSTELPEESAANEAGNKAVAKEPAAPSEANSLAKPAATAANASNVPVLSEARSESEPSGNWHVQFGAFSEEGNARRRWGQLKSSEVLPDSLAPRYQSVGNLVRLLTDIGVAEQEARDLCDEIKSSGLGDCLVRQLDN